MYEKLEVCPVCGNTKFTNFLICSDHSVSKESFALVQCSNCSTILTNPRPSAKYLSKYYEDDQYISHSNKANTPINFLYKAVRLYTIRKKIKLISKLVPNKGKLLDYGSGTGHFLKATKSNNWESTGVEPDASARRFAIDKLNLSVEQEIPDQKGHYDIITAWHVLEHVSEFEKTVKKLKKILKPDGYLILALPNYESYDANHYQEYWAAYDVPRHLYHFSQNSMKHFAKRFRLKLIDQKPMHFDSYYVSMLSEKYKGGRLLNGILLGYQSNKSAKKDSNFSSIIYIFQK